MWACVRETDDLGVGSSLCQKKLIRKENRNSGDQHQDPKQKMKDACKKDGRKVQVPHPDRHPACTDLHTTARTMPPCSAIGAHAFRDPHLVLARGGRADFRGRDGHLFAFFSAPGLAVNVKTEEATFGLGNLTVNGSFITEAHVVARVGGAKRKWANASFWASELNAFNTGWQFVNGSCGGRLFWMGLGLQRRCEELSIGIKYSSATFSVRGWSITVRGNSVHSSTAGARHRLDLSLSADSRGVAARSLPHGILGQSFSSPVRREGKVDIYPTAPGRFTTSAQAEGAIEGSAAMYEVRSPYATDFAFSRFEASEREAELTTAPTSATFSESRRLSEVPCPPPSPPSGVDTTSAEAVLRAQMDDMQAGSTLVAYQLASPGNRASTAWPSGYNLDRFDQMVRGATYNPLISGFGYEVLPPGVQVSGSQAAANVQVFRDASRSQSLTYEFRMSKQPHSVVDTHSSLAPYELLPGRSGREVWRTNSVLVVSGP